MIDGKRVLLIISGGIAAYKMPRTDPPPAGSAAARSACILTKGGENFVTPLSLTSLTGDTVFREMFSLTEEREIGHINLGRQTDLVVVAPATANMMAKMAMGVADDLATTTLLATDRPILVAPSMNVRMWEHDATQVNLRILRSRGVRIVGPEEGPMACNEFGFGRMAEPEDILVVIEGLLTRRRPPRRPQGPGHQRPDFRSHRPCPLHRQPLVGKARATPLPTPSRGWARTPFSSPDRRTNSIRSVSP